MYTHANMGNTKAIYGGTMASLLLKLELVLTISAKTIMVITPNISKNIDIIFNAIENEFFLKNFEISQDNPSSNPITKMLNTINQKAIIRLYTKPPPSISKLLYKSFYF